MRGFITLWAGQTVSTLGSSLTAFSLGVWVYQRNHSVTQFSVIFLLAALPKILLAPVAGALVDRWNRRTAMMVSDTGAALGTLAVVLLLWTGNLEVWHVYLVTTVGSVFSTLQWLAYSAATTTLLPREGLGRANGFIQFSSAISQLASPAVAGLLLASIQLRGVILVDFATFLFSLLTLLLVRVPDLAKEGTTVDSERRTLLKDAFYGLGYLKARPGLLALLVFFAIANLSLGFVQSLVTPLVLTFASAKELGVIASISGSGMLVSSILLAAWGGPKKLIRGVLFATLLQGVVLFLVGFRANAILISIGGFCFMFLEPVIGGCSQTLWQRKVEPQFQGRVFAMRQMIAWSSLPIAYALAGPLADRVFEPLLAPGGALVGSLGGILGVGTGRGTGLLIIVLGLLCVVAALAGFFYSPLRRLEEDVPDAALLSEEPAKPENEEASQAPSAATMPTASASTPSA